MQANSISLPINRQLLKLFFREVDINPRIKFNNAPCWLWSGTITDGGYARFVFKKVPYQAHRLAYEWFVESINVKDHADHLCRRRHCVNPAHIEAVPPRINTLRGDAASAINARKTHCKRGHEFTEENTYYFDYGNKERKGRMCKTCRRKLSRTPPYKARRNARLARKRRTG